MRTRCFPRAAALVVLAVAVLLPVAVAPGAAAQDEGGTVLRVHQRFYPSLLDPQQTGFIDDINVLALAYEGLTRLNDKLEVVPAAAESWDFNADGTVVTFRLRAGLTYADGSPLTAARFRDAALRTCDPATAGQYQGILFLIEGCEAMATGGGAEASPVAETASPAADAAFGVEAPDDRTLVVRLTAPAPYFPAVASLWVFYPVQRELVAAGGEGWWQDAANHVGNGPFRIASIEEDQRIAFRANERYWGGRPTLDGIEYVYIGDNAVALEAYRQDQIDVMYVDPSQVDAIAVDEVLSAEFLKYPGAFTAELNFNLRQAPFTDTKVREAFAYAFDRDTWCAEVLSGGCVPATTWLPEGLPGTIEDATYAFDPEKARQALAASSYGGPDTLPPIAYAYVSDDPAEQTRAEWIAGQYRDVLGVELDLVGYDVTSWVEMFTSSDRFPQMTISGWGQDYPDPQNWLSIIWTCQATNLAVNIGYCNAEFDALIAQADAELDPATRTALYEQAHRLLLADVPSVIVHREARLFLVKPGVTGYVPTASDAAFPGEWGSALTIDVAR